MRGRLIRGVGQLLCVIVPFMVQEADALLIEVIDGRFALNLDPGRFPSPAVLLGERFV